MPSLVIADDDPVYLDMVAEVLADAGFTDVHCTTRRQAFPCIEQRQPMLVLLDVNEANPDAGWNTLHLMRLTATTRAIPVLVCTTDPNTVRQKGAMLRAQGCDILEKPFDLEVLLDKIQILLACRSAPAESGHTVLA